MTSRKPKVDLTAIYRLEFYKKQSNWKLSSSIRKEKDQKQKLSISLRNKLNETYCINDNARDDISETNPLNLAFCELEKEQEESNPSHLVQQWLTPVNIWPESITKPEQKNYPVKCVETDECGGYENYKNKACVHERLEVLLRVAKEHEYDARSEPALENVTKENIPEKNDFNIEEELNVDENDWALAEFHHSVQSEPWTNFDDIWFDHDVINGFNRNSRPDGDWDSALANDVLITDRVEADSAIDSSSEFIRGAHDAPHSSETDIALPAELQVSNVTTKLLCNLSTRQLNEAIYEHWAVISKLQSENERRQQERPYTSELGSYDERPTRDVGPYPNGDVFVAGSHKTVHQRAIGRGRGRIVPNGQRY